MAKPLPQRVEPQRKKGPHLVVWALLGSPPFGGGVFGGVLLSHTPSGAVPSALQGLASGFGMGPGVSLAQWPPKHSCVVVPHLGCGGRSPCLLFGISYSGREQSSNSHLVVGSSLFGGVISPRPISTSQLHTLLCFHVWPINPMVCRGPYPLNGGESPHLEACFPLRCFQRLSFPNVANQPCPWQDNWHTRGWSVPVLSY